MLLSAMRQHNGTLPAYKRHDGEIFDISYVLYDSPSGFDYWLVYYVTSHLKWGIMRFTLTVPKMIAATVPLALTLVAGTPLAQVQSYLSRATSEGRPYEPCFSHDGWVLT